MGRVGQPRDRYGRLLAYVHRPGRSGSRGSVNFALVGTGHARVYVYGGVRFTHAGAFFRAQSRARTAGTGLWGPPCRGNTTKPDPGVRAPAATPAPAPPGDGCDPNYAGACIPVSPPDIDCGEIPDRNFRVVGTDVHNLDADDNRIACEECPPAAPGAGHRATHRFTPAGPRGRPSAREPATRGPPSRP